MTVALAATLAARRVVAQPARTTGPAAPPTQDYLLYAVAESADQLALVRFGTNERGKSVSVFDVATGAEVARIPTHTGEVHGVVVSPGSRHAFATEEGRGSEPGILEVFDLRSVTSVAKVELGQKAAGVDFCRIEAVK